MISEIFSGKISVEYSSDPEPGHYEITPYSFRPRVAKTVVPTSHYDLGQGILDVIYEVYSKSDNSSKDISIIRKLMEHER
jgi:UDP-glucose 4-epimerase